jgi:hypothetical protein
MLSPSKNFLSFEKDKILQDPTISFLLPSYAKAQALASPPSWIVSRGCHLGVKAFIDDEALESL